MWLTSVFDSMQVVFPREPLSHFATQRPPSSASSWSPGPQRFLCQVIWCLQEVREVCRLARRLQHGPGTDQHCCITKPWTNRVVIIISVSTSQPIGHSGDKEVDPEPELSLCQFIAAGRFIPTPVSPATFPCRPSLLPPFVLKPAELDPVFLLGLL